VLAATVKVLALDLTMGLWIPFLCKPSRPMLSGRYVLFSFPRLTIIICNLTRRAVVVLFIWITIAGVAGQVSCCTGTAAAAGGGSAAPPAFGTTSSNCKSADSAYSWVFKTCSGGQTCRSFPCTVSAAGITLSNLKYQDCYDDTTFAADIKAKSINSFKCTDGVSGSAGIKVSLVAVLVASAGVLSLIF